MPQPLTCTAPRSFAPSCSPLGRIVRRRVPDARQAEGAYWAALVILSATALFAGQWAWFVLAGGPGLPEVLAAMAAGLVLAGFGLAGWHPLLVLTVTDEHLVVHHGPERQTLPLRDVASVRRVPASEAHDHWLRYAATRAFVNRMPDELLLLRTSDATPVLIGLPPSELARLEAALDRGEVERVDVERMEVEGVDACVPGPRL